MPSRDPERSARVTGVLLVLAAAAANELTLGALLLARGATFPPGTRLLLATADLALAGLGAFLVVRARLPRPGRAALDLARRHRRLAAVLFGTGLALAPFVLAEGTLQVRKLVREWRAARGGTGGPAARVEIGFLADNLLGYRPRPSTRATTTWLLPDGSRHVWSCHFDAHSRRVVPVPDPERPRELFLECFGCSFMFGEGVNDDETLPARLARLLPRYRPYDFGDSGYGPHQMLALLESPRVLEGVSEKTGDGVYVFIDHHVARAVDTMVVHDQIWGWCTPCYEVDDAGRVVWRGSFETAHPVRSRLLELLGKSELVSALGLDLPPITDADLERVARIIARASELFRLRFPGRRFLVVIYPGSRLGIRVAARLRTLGVEVLDASGLFDPTLPGLSIPGNGHPTALAYARLAESVADALGR